MSEFIPDERKHPGFWKFCEVLGFIVVLLVGLALVCGLFYCTVVGISTLVNGNCTCKTCCNAIDKCTCGTAATVIEQAEPVKQVTTTTATPSTTRHVYYVNW